MIARALESKEKRKDAKGTKKKKRDECYSIGRKTETGSSFNAAALKTQCRSIGKKEKNPKIGKMVNAATLSTQCHSIRGLWKIEDSMSQH